MDGFVQSLFIFENFAQEIGKKNSKHAHKVGKNGQKVYKNIKIMNFPAKSQLNFASSHDGETVTFRKSD